MFNQILNNMNMNYLIFGFEAQKLRRYLCELKYWVSFTTYHYNGVDSHFKIGT